MLTVCNFAAVYHRTGKGYIPGDSIQMHFWDLKLWKWFHSSHSATMSDYWQSEPSSLHTIHWESKRTTLSGAELQLKNTTRWSQIPSVQHFVMKQSTRENLKVDESQPFSWQRTRLPITDLHAPFPRQQKKPKQCSYQSATGSPSPRRTLMWENVTTLQQTAERVGVAVRLCICGSRKSSV